jgi:hypothetical protein
MAAATIARTTRLVEIIDPPTERARQDWHESRRWRNQYGRRFAVSRHRWRIALVHEPEAPGFPSTTIRSSADVIHAFAFLRERDREEFWVAALDGMHWRRASSSETHRDRWFPVRGPFSRSRPSW